MRKLPPFTAIPHKYYFAIISSDLKLIELKAMFVLIRLIQGCHRPTAKIIQADLKAIGLTTKQAFDAWHGLINKGTISVRATSLEVEINWEWFLRNSKYNEDKITKMITANLSKRGYADTIFDKENVIKSISMGDTLMPAQSHHLCPKDSKEILKKANKGDGSGYKEFKKGIENRKNHTVLKNASVGEVREEKRRRGSL